MNYRIAMIGLAALAGTAFTSPARAMPNGLPTGAQPLSSNAEQVRYVCDWRGRCWWRPGGPRFYGAYGWGPRWRGGHNRHWHGRHGRHWRY